MTKRKGARASDREEESEYTKEKHIVFEHSDGAFSIETHTYSHTHTHIDSIFIDSIDVRLFVICLHSVSPVVSFFVRVLFSSSSSFLFLVLFCSFHRCHYFIFINFIIAIVIIMNHHHLIMLKLRSYFSLPLSNAVEFSLALALPFHCVVVITFFLSFVRSFIHSFHSNPFQSHLICNSSLQFLIHAIAYIHIRYVYTAYIMYM